MIDIIKKNKFLWSFFSSLLRLNYSFFWKIRNYSPSNDGGTIYKKYYEDEIIKEYFKRISRARIVELGCGYGLRLFNLKKNKKKFILNAKKFNKNKKLNIKFYNQDIRKIRLKSKIDYLISSFSLIYLKKKDLIIFFKNNKNMIKKGFLLIEYHSPNKSNNLSYYVHDFKQIFLKADMNNFKINFKEVFYKKWIKKDHKAYKIIGAIK